MIVPSLEAVVVEVDLVEVVGVLVGAMEEAVVAVVEVEVEAEVEAVMALEPI
jgi:hypothetical protein